MKRLLLILILSSLSMLAVAGFEEGTAAADKGDYKTAYEHFLPLAEKGNLPAMMKIAQFFREGKPGIPQDYEKAMDWYLNVVRAGYAEAFNDIGVMYRDGLGVKQNRQIAYLLFVYTHRGNVGSGSFKAEAIKNQQREEAELPQAVRDEALCYSFMYLKAYVIERGKIDGIPKDLKGANGQERIKDMDWWYGEERKALLRKTCPAHT